MHWKQLKVGDRIRIVKMPYDANTPEYTFSSETRTLYRKLIKRNRPLRVFQIDSYGIPWISCRFKLKSGRWEHHSLAIKDDSWVLVKSKGQKECCYPETSSTE